MMQTKILQAIIILILDIAYYNMVKLMKVMITYDGNRPVQSLRKDVRPWLR